MAKFNLSEIGELINKAPLIAIDNSILVTNLKKISKQNKIDLFNIISKAIFHYLNIANEKEKSHNIFSNEISQKNREFISIVLLRILNKDENFFKELTIQHYVIKLFDTIFNYNIYKKLNIKESDQTFSKIQKLRDYVNEIEEDITKEVSNISDIEQLDAIQKTFIRTLRHKETLIIVLPFLSIEIQGERFLTEIFNSIRNYLQSPAEEKYHAYSNAKTQIEIIISKYFDNSDLKQNFSYYQNNFYGKFIKNLFHLLTSHFEGSPYGKSAEISNIRLLPKKHTFSIGKAYRIGFSLTKKGEGIISNIKIEFIRLDIL